MATRGLTPWLAIAFSLLTLLSLWVTVATGVDPDGPWWMPLIFGAFTVIAAGNAVVWIRASRRSTAQKYSSQPDRTGSQEST